MHLSSTAINIHLQVEHSSVPTLEQQQPSCSIIASHEAFTQTAVTCFLQAADLDACADLSKLYHNSLASSVTLVLMLITCCHVLSCRLPT
jgi:hypothetical protein